MKLGSILTPEKKGRRLDASAAVQRISRDQVQREYADTPALKLFEIQDETQAHIAWLRQMGREVDSMDERKLAEAATELDRRRESDPAVLNDSYQSFLRRNKIRSYFPDEGPYRRELYPQHMLFLDAGAKYRNRLACMANKVGKSTMAAYEVTCHATGRYPDWWKGKRFDHPVLCWVGNKSAKETRDINEKCLLGSPGDSMSRGTAMLPAHLIKGTTPKPGVPHGCEFIYVQHVSRGTSTIQSKSFDAGRKAFQGDPEVHVIWLDEECPSEIAEECAMRTMTCGGIILITYTPIMGLTTLTLDFLDACGVSLDSLRILDDGGDDEYARD